jgi:hypothetical protein
MRKALNVFGLAASLAAASKDGQHNQEHDANEGYDDAEFKRRDDETDERNQLFQERDD